MGLGAAVVESATSKGSEAITSFLDPALRASKAAADSTFPNVLPDSALILDAWRKKIITPEQASALLKLHGVNFQRDAFQENNEAGKTLNKIAKFWEALKPAFFEPPSPQEVLALLNRTSVDEPLARKLLARSGIRETSDQDLVLQLRNEIPGPPDLVRFAIRNVWVPEIVDQYRLDEEIRQEFIYWMDRQGLNWDARTKDQIAAGNPPVTWSQLHWRAHWVQVAPTQAYAMYHRLREGRLGRYEELGMRPGIFDLNALRTLMRENDYSPFWRDKLAAVESTPLGRVDIRRMLDTDVIDEREAHEQFLDRGYVPEDARRLVRFTVQLRRIQQSNKVREDTRAHITKAYQIGAIDSEAAATRLYRLTILDPEQLALWDGLDAAAQWRLASGQIAELVFPPAPPGRTYSVTLRSFPTILAELALADAELDSKRLDTAIKSIHNCYKRGEITLPEVRGLLTRLGLVPRRIDTYIDLWQLECGRRHKEFMTGQVQKYSREGLITADEARRRLVNLGWSNDDALILLADIQRSVNLDIAKAAAAAARTVKQQQAALAAAVKAAQAQTKQLQAELSKHGSPAELAKWFVRGLISIQAYLRRLQALGWPLADAQRALSVAEQDRITYVAKQAKAAQQSQSAGSSSSGGTAGAAG